MSFLNLGLHILTADDAVGSSNPRLVTLDRNLQGFGVSVGKTKTIPLDPPLAPGASLTAFDGTRTIGWDSTTQLALSLSSLGPDRYRLTWTTVGTNPAFRPERAFAASGFSLTLTLNANLTVTVTGAGPAYTNAQAGDAVTIPGVATGDPAGPFDARNVGAWTVIGVTSTSLTLARAAGWTGGITETVAVTSNDQLLVFGQGGAQAGDQLEIAAGFAPNSRRAYRVLAVTPRWVDLQSLVAVAAETAVPGANGLTVYSSARRIIMIEVDQMVSVQLNAATAVVVEPMTLPDGTRLGIFFKTGPVWRCVVTSLSATEVGGLVAAVG